MTLFSKMLGREGEDRAVEFLARRGYKIIERNYNARVGEIDIIALQEGTIVFIEVKTRTSSVYGAPELAVNQQKQQRMIRAALSYIRYKKLHQMPCRFDVVAISSSAGRDPELIQNAFEMDRTHV